MIGTKCSQRGIDAKSCPDYRLVFSSYFPTLKIYKTYNFYIADTSVSQVICSHDLGYVPAFWIFTDGGLGRYRLSPSQYLAMNKKDLLWRSGAGAGSLTGRVFIFAFDISKSYLSDDKSATVKSSNESDDFGIKVIKNSPPLEDKDYSLNSENRYPQIHIVGQGSNNETIKHNLGYEPMYFLWAIIDDYGDNRYQSVSSADDSFVTATSTTFHYQFLSNGTASYIIFKDPILI
jgi:hypothetical protein